MIIIKINHVTRVITVIAKSSGTMWNMRAISLPKNSNRPKNYYIPTVTAVEHNLDKEDGLWLITGLITGQTFELHLFISHGFQPIRCSKLGHMFEVY